MSNETKTLKIDGQLQTALPALDKETLAALERSIQEEGGAYEPITVWKGKGIIVDGHNRYEICTRLKLPFKTDEREFKSKDEARFFMLEKQMGRRNLTDAMLSEIRGQYLQLLRRQRGVGQKAPKGKTTAQVAADKFGTSPATVKRDANFAKGIEHIAKHKGEDEAQKVRENKSSVNKSQVEEIGKAKGRNIKSKVEAVFSTKEKPKPSAKAETPKADPEKAKQDRLRGAVELFLTGSTKQTRKAAVTTMASALTAITGTEYKVPAEYEDAKGSPKKAAPKLASKGKGKTAAKTPEQSAYND